MLYEEIEDRYKKIIDIAKNYMNTIKDNEHDINHMNDVVKYTKELLNIVNVNINKEVCIISAYWHDVGRIKQNVDKKTQCAIYNLSKGYDGACETYLKIFKLANKENIKNSEEAKQAVEKIARQIIKQKEKIYVQK